MLDAAEDKSRQAARLRGPTPQEHVQALSQQLHAIAQQLAEVQMQRPPLK